MTVNAKLHRVYEFREPEPLRVELHAIDCPCCAPPAEQRLTFVDLGVIALYGAAVGSAIAFAIDPAGAAHALLAIVGR